MRIKFHTRLLIMLSLVINVYACNEQDDIIKYEHPSHEKDIEPTIMSIGVVDVEGGIIGVAARRPGVISNVFVEEGDIVEKGQLMAKLEDVGTRLSIRHAQSIVEITQSNIELAKTELGIAQRNLGNVLELYEQGHVSKSRYDDLRDEVKRKKANLSVLVKKLHSDKVVLAQREYENDLNYIKAPIDGTVVRRYANPGEGASTLNVSVMFEVEPDTNHIIRAEVSEQFINDVTVGQEVEFWPQLFPESKMSGKVMRISNIFGSRSLKFENTPSKTDERVIEVIINIDEEKLIIGQRVMVKFLPPA